MSTITEAEIASDPQQFFRLLEGGQPVVVLKDGVAVAEVRPIPPRRTEPRPSGLAKGKFVVPEDFDAPLPDDILDAFEGR
jgi:antitoxin (DNA-binding transcriptional repressor) of toxin-antitoxin stability system